MQFTPFNYIEIRILAGNYWVQILSLTRIALETIPQSDGVIGSATWGVTPKIQQISAQQKATTIRKLKPKIENSSNRLRSAQQIKRTRSIFEGLQFVFRVDLKRPEKIGGTNIAGELILHSNFE